MTTELLLDPVSGEVLPDEDKPLLEAILAADVEIRDLYERARTVRDLRDTLTRTLADRGKYELPPRRNRTRTQECVGRCKRCGDAL